ncbi:hypothetical protein TMatcc_006969 [Talaromyces marneffei ATCC 18224]
MVECCTEYNLAQSLAFVLLLLWLLLIMSRVSGCGWRWHCSLKNFFGNCHKPLGRPYSPFEKCLDLLYNLLFEVVHHIIFRNSMNTYLRREGVNKCIRCSFIVRFERLEIKCGATGSSKERTKGILVAVGILCFKGLLIYGRRDEFRFVLVVVAGV